MKLWEALDQLAAAVVQDENEEKITRNPTTDHGLKLQWKHNGMAVVAHIEAEITKKDAIHTAAPRAMKK